MQQQIDKQSFEQTQAAPAKGATRGPVVLSAELLELVSGGSPRGGWIEPEGQQQLDTGTQSPRGGW